MLFVQCHAGVFASSFRPKCCSRAADEDTDIRSRRASPPRGILTILGARDHLCRCPYTWQMTAPPPPFGMAFAHSRYVAVGPPIERQLGSHSDVQRGRVGSEPGEPALSWSTSCPCWSDRVAQSATKCAPESAVHRNPNDNRDRAAAKHGLLVSAPPTNRQSGGLSREAGESRDEALMQAGHRAIREGLAESARGDRVHFPPVPPR